MAELTEKSYQVWENQIDDKGRDMGEARRILVLRSKALVVRKGAFVTKKDLVVPLEDIDEILIDTGENIANADVLTGAIAGGLLFGGVGAIVGGLSGMGQSKAWYITIKKKDGVVHVYRLHNGDDRKRILKWANKKGV